MTKVSLFAGGRLSSISVTGDVVVGVDRACLTLIQQGHILDMAVGDFDSVTWAEKHLIKNKARRMIEASAEKDDTDTELALIEVFRLWPNADVTIYGAFGGRLDHELSNLFLPSHPQLRDKMTQITLQDEQNHVYFYPKGRHLIEPYSDMTYISFMLEGQGRLEILGAKYPLTEHNYFERKIYSSNEFLDGPISVEVPDGYLIVIASKDKG